MAPGAAPLAMKRILPVVQKRLVCKCRDAESEPRRQRRTALSPVDPVGQQKATRLPTRRREQRPSLPLLKRKRAGRGTSRAPSRSYGEIQIGFASTTAVPFSQTIPHTTGRQSRGISSS